MANTNPVEFLQEVRNEAKKVVWPSRKELMVSTIMVDDHGGCCQFVFSGRGCGSEMGR